MAMGCPGNGLEAAFLVGGIGVANTMVIAVLERRSEIGLRRALGATRRQIMGQFLSESITLSLAGGLAGAALGVLVVSVYALARDWPGLNHRRRCPRRAVPRIPRRPHHPAQALSGA